MKRKGRDVGRSGQQWRCVSSAAIVVVVMLAVVVVIVQEGGGDEGVGEGWRRRASQRERPREGWWLGTRHRHTEVWPVVLGGSVCGGRQKRRGGEVGLLSTGPRRSCYSDTGMLAMPLSKVTEIQRKYPRCLARVSRKFASRKKKRKERSRVFSREVFLRREREIWLSFEEFQLLCAKSEGFW